MKKKQILLEVVTFLSWLIILVVVISCSKSKTVEEEQAGISKEVIEMAIKVPDKESKDNFDVLNVVFTAHIEDKTGEILKKEVSENLLNYLELNTQEEFEKFITEHSFRKQVLASLSANVGYNVINPNTIYAGEHSDCIEGCVDKYTDEDGNKKKGRGRCKFNCWVDTAIRVIDAISPF